MPSYLVRISDMKLVQGSEVHEGYCALSYSWNQSGEIIKNKTTNNCDRMDQGKHKIIYPGKTIRKKPRGRKRIPGKVKFVKFEELIQEIGKDFNIKYIWYDQMCINQNDEEEKHGEIHQMHKIYSHAYCTIALVPELITRVRKRYPDTTTCLIDMRIGYLLGSQWMKRMWTLEETILSTKMLFVGRNVHCWWYRLSKDHFPIFYKDFVCDVATILHYAHTRTSTKEHDCIFALANIFPGVIQEITIDYNQDVQELMMQFYGALAKKDLSILCFGKYTHYKTMCKTSCSDSTKKDSNTRKKVDHDIPIQKFNLPSWTGVYGEHFKYGGYKTSFKNYTVSRRVLKITCRGMCNDQHQTDIPAILSITRDDIPPLPQQNANDDCGWLLVIPIRLPGFTNEKFIEVYTVFSGATRLHPEAYRSIIIYLRNLSHFIPINKMNLQWIPARSGITTSWFGFHQLVETMQDFCQYVLLTEVQFTLDDKRFAVRHPILKKVGDHYKAIGLCTIGKDPHFFDNTTLEEQIFEIH
ncbi:hypothetical protein INT45_009834 [Circinella minor]|uniref:Heterokaryon incompatibility domain-containing protein n=1 Tax=Circinella minor TaxID=1195481 RepID=A0A8H7S695_9FUNG|nr:hypothetical protein INT45_009834 [Circinella minor]